MNRILYIRMQFTYTAINYHREHDISQFSVISFRQNLCEGTYDDGICIRTLIWNKIVMI